MTLFTQDQIRNLNIQKRFRQIPICDVDLYNVTLDQQELIKEGKAQNWIINGFQQFSGIIKKVDKDDNKPIWHVHSEGAACILRDTIQESDTIYKDTLVTTIISALVPNGWTVNYTITGDTPKLWYHVTPGSALSHISNVVRLAGLEWEVTQSYTMVGDTPTYGNYILNVSSHLGSTSITTAYVNNTNCYNLVLKQNQDKVYTSIQAVGSSPESARMESTITADSPFTCFSTLTSNESYLTSSITATATTIPIADATHYTPPGIVSIEAEYISYTDKAGNNLIGCTRGTTYGTTAAAHPINSDVLNMSSLTFSPDIPLYLPSANGTIMVGSEPINYQYKISGKVYSTSPFPLGRNTQSATLAFPHHKGAVVRPRNTVPVATSYASLNGLRKTTMDAMGSIDQDGVDLKAGIILLKTATSAPYGSMYLTSTDVWKQVTLGDRITVTQAATWISSTTTFASHLSDGSTHSITVPCKIKATAEVIDTRIIGITWNQYKPVLIEYGDVDLFILDDFANAAKAYNTAINRNDNTTSAIVDAVDPNDPSCIQISIRGVPTWAKKV